MTGRAATSAFLVAAILSGCGGQGVEAPPLAPAAERYPQAAAQAIDAEALGDASAALAAEFQTLADWKTTKGVPTVIRTTEWIEANYRNGSDQQETIREFIKDAYAKWGITYALLGGDTDQVPARLCWSGYYDGGRNLPVDMYYACLDGNWNADGDDRFGEEEP